MSHCKRKRREIIGDTVSEMARLFLKLPVQRERLYQFALYRKRQRAIEDELRGLDKCSRHNQV